MGTHLARLPLVGRELELETLRGAVDACASDDRGVVIVTGDAGIGKTRLLRELAAELARRDPPGVVAWGACLHMADVDLPLAPVPSLIDDLARRSGDRGVADVAERARHELLADADGGELPALGAGAGGRRLRAFERVVDLVRYQVLVQTRIRHRPMASPAVAPSLVPIDRGRSVRRRRCAMVRPLGYRLGEELIRERHRAADRDQLVRSFAAADAERRNEVREAPKRMVGLRTAIARVLGRPGPRHGRHVLGH